MGEPYKPGVGDVLRLEAPAAGPDWEDDYRRLAVAAVLGARRGERAGEVRDGDRLVGTWSYEPTATSKPRPQWIAWPGDWVEFRGERLCGATYGSS